MRYVGKLFGQIGRTRGYFDTGKTSEDWDALEARAERAEAELASERGRLDSGQIMLIVAGERVWHSGVDLRAAIDAKMKEGAK
jgi:hypothetical protein